MATVPITREEIVEKASATRERIREIDLELLELRSEYFELGRDVFTILFDGEHNTPKLANIIFGDYSNPVSKTCVDAVVVLADVSGFTPELAHDLVIALCASKHRTDEEADKDARDILVKAGLNAAVAACLVAPLSVLLA